MSAAVPPPPPPGTNYIAVIGPTLNSVLIAHSFTIILIPLALALFYFSSPSTRVKPIFILNLITISLAFTVGVLLDYSCIRTIVSPTNPPPLAYNIVIGVLGAAQSILVDTILLLRLIAVYPKTYVGINQFLLLIALPVILKIGRVINLLMFIKVLAVAARDPVNPSVRISQIWLAAPYLKIEWFMQLFDNTYASGFFLWRLVLRNKENRSLSVTSFSTVSFTERLQTLIWIAVTNFVFPVLFSLAQIIIVYREVNYVIVNEVVLANTMVAVIGVVFATIWAGSFGKQNHIQSDDGSGTPGDPKGEVLSALAFRSVRTVRSDTDLEEPMGDERYAREKHVAAGEESSSRAV